MSDESELAELLGTDPQREGQQRCWSALARIVDDDPTFVYGDEDGSGMNVNCMVLTGPFAGCLVPAMVSCPLGSGVDLSPLRGGMRVMLHFLDGTPDGLIVAGATVPGGKETPLPRAVAGVAIDEKGLATQRVVAPGKGVGMRFYIQGAPFVLRLKGSTPSDPVTGEGGFAGELYIEADDANSPGADGQNGTFVRLVIDPTTGLFGIKARTAQGAFVNLLDDTVTLSSGDGENKLLVDNTGVSVFSKTFRVDADSIAVNGLILLNWLPGNLPLTGNGGALYIAPAPTSPVPGPIPVLGQSQSVFIGS